MTTPISQTPETDAATLTTQILSHRSGLARSLYDGGELKFVTVAFARSLELRLREAEEHQQVEFHTCAGKDCCNAVCRLRQDRDAQKKRADEAEKHLRDANKGAETNAKINLELIRKRQAIESERDTQKQRADEWKKVATGLFNSIRIAAELLNDEGDVALSESLIKSGHLEQFNNLKQKEPA